MAILPLNTFRTITRTITAFPPAFEEIYTCPTGVTAIVLLAQVSNVGVDTVSVSFAHVKDITVTFLVRNARIPKEDALSVLTGRLVLEEGHRVRVFTDENSSGNLQIVLSIVESANT
jgi:hypothetical protein